MRYIAIILIALFCIGCGSLGMRRIYDEPTVEEKTVEPKTIGIEFFGSRWLRSFTGKIVEPDGTQYEFSTAPFQPIPEKVIGKLEID